MTEQQIAEKMARLIAVAAEADSCVEEAEAALEAAKAHRAKLLAERDALRAELKSVAGAALGLRTRAKAPGKAQKQPAPAGA